MRASTRSPGPSHLGPNLWPMPLAPPQSLTPSKVTSFTSCPLAFRFSAIDRLPEPPSPHAVKGTLVHAALEGLIWNRPAGQRTVQAALDELHAAWEELAAAPEMAELAMSDEETGCFLADAARLVENYFLLEDPDTVHAVGVELGLEVGLGPIRLRGIIDRLDLTEDGQLVVVDYKTGRAPPARFEQGRLSGVHLYALLCRHALGRTPVEVRLLHLREPLTIAATPSAQSVDGQQRRAAAIWAAIERACRHDDFQPRPSPLCQSCNFKSLCPAFGGELPGSVAP